MSQHIKWRSRGARYLKDAQTHTYGVILSTSDGLDLDHEIHILQRRYRGLRVVERQSATHQILEFRTTAHKLRKMEEQLPAEIYSAHWKKDS